MKLINKETECFVCKQKVKYIIEGNNLKWDICHKCLAKEILGLKDGIYDFILKDITNNILKQEYGIDLDTLDSLVKK